MSSSSWPIVLTLIAIALGAVYYDAHNADAGQEHDTSAKTVAAAAQ